MGHPYHIMKGNANRKYRWCNVDEELAVVHLFSQCRLRFVEDLKRELGIKDVKLLGSSDEAHLRACCVERRAF